jgi:hypothetical protein
MEVVLTTNEPVRLSFVLMLLREAGCQPVTLDGYMAVAEGSAGAIQRRIAVPASLAETARRVLHEAGEL